MFATPIPGRSAWSTSRFMVEDAEKAEDRMEYGALGLRESDRWTFMQVTPRSSEANTAVCLVAHELSTHCNETDLIETVRAGVLRKALSERFGAAQAWSAMNKLWRRAPASPGAPQPSEDRSRLTPGPMADRRGQPRWIGELNEAAGAAPEWLTENGLWCG
jgi:hypothetical protein